MVQHKKKIGSQQKQKREARSNNTDCHLQGLCCHEDTSLTFHSASETKHKKIKYRGKHLPYQLSHVSVLNPVRKLHTQHTVSNQRRKVLTTSSQNHAAMKWPNLGSSFKVSYRMPHFSPLYAVNVTRGSHSLGNNPQFSHYLQMSCFTASFISQATPKFPFIRLYLNITGTLLFITILL